MMDAQRKRSGVVTKTNSCGKAAGAYFMPEFRSFWVLALAMLFGVGGCNALEKEMNLNVVVFNYNPQAIAELTIQGQYIGGYYYEYGPGGTGGKSHCCIEVKAGPAKVEWEFDRVPGTPPPPEGFIRTATGQIPKAKGQPRYLGVHVYPGNAVEFTLTPDWPGEKQRGTAHE